jgi:hypothetical protein
MSGVFELLKQANEVENNSRLSIKMRRRLGLERNNLRRTVKKLMVSSDWEDYLDGNGNVDVPMLARSVAVTLTGHPDYAEAWCEIAQSQSTTTSGSIVDFDWQSLLNFIEKMIPIILKLIELFMMF